MMMAYDSSQPPPSRLDEDTVAAVSAALRAYLSDPSSASALRGALQRMSAEAHEKDILAEHLLIILKDVWVMLPEVRAMTDSGAHVRLLEHVVTMCIREYYRA